MILLIDNYDSFTYNLAQYFGELGEEVEVVRNDGSMPLRTHSPPVGAITYGAKTSPVVFAALCTWPTR